MRRLALWILAAFAFLRYLSWRRTKAAIPAAVPPEPVEPETDPRAEELRAKLEARAEEEPAVAPKPEPVAGPEPDERRRSVHERGRRAAEQMRDSSSGE
jgi:hypothetical protein